MDRDPFPSMSRRGEVVLQLNEAQWEAVSTVEGPLLILAGAGSGKTRTLTERIVYLLERGLAQPEEILAITFTNKAAQEMRRRVELRLAGRVRDLWIMTFHRASLEILRREIERLGYRTDFVVYDTQDQLAVVRQALRAENVSEERFAPRDLLWRISRLKNELKEPTAIGEGFADDVLRRVFERYQAFLREQNAVDFDDLIGLTVRLFETEPEVLARYQERFRFVHVDEYQDTNMAQYRWLRLLTERHRNLAVVGDPDQSIYGWRGADIRNILEFERDFPGARTVILDRNYRSTRRILAAANAVVRENRQRLDKELWTDGPEGRPIVYVETEDGRREAEWVAEEVLHLVARGRSLRDMAVLVRTNAQTRPLEEAFLRHRIPYLLVGGIRFYERAEVKDVLAYLRLLVRPDDEVAFLRAVSAPRRGVGEATIQLLREEADRRGLSLYRAIPFYRGRGQTVFQAFYDQLESWKSISSLARLVEVVREQSGLKAQWQAEGVEICQQRLDNVKALEERAREAELEGDDLSTFLDRVALLSDVDEIREGEDALLLLTIHAAKGLEFPVVFLPGLEEGILPHARAMAEDRDVEEERRLAYVAMTRAKEELYLLRAERRLVGGAYQPTLVSRFLKAIPRHLLEERRGHGDPPRIHGVSLAWRGNERGTAIDEFQVGEKVIHPVFGYGVVVMKAGAGPDQELKIAFEGRGIKDILPRYAALRRA